MDFLIQTPENWTHSISAVASPWLVHHSSRLNQSQHRSHGFNKNASIRTSGGDFVSKLSAFKHYFRYCATWAKLKECTQNPGWMLVHCPVACDQCDVKCNNNNVYCDDWARAGECTKNKEYMNIYCSKVKFNYNLELKSYEANLILTLERTN